MQAQTTKRPTVKSFDSGKGKFTIDWRPVKVAGIQYSVSLPPNDSRIRELPEYVEYYKETRALTLPEVPKGLLSDMTQYALSIPSSQPQIQEFPEFAKLVRRNRIKGMKDIPIPESWFSDVDSLFSDIHTITRPMDSGSDIQFIVKGKFYKAPSENKPNTVLQIDGTNAFHMIFCITHIGYAIGRHFLSPNMASKDLVPNFFMSDLMRREGST